MELKQIIALTNTRFAVYGLDLDVGVSAGIVVVMGEFGLGLG